MTNEKLPVTDEVDELQRVARDYLDNNFLVKADPTDFQAKIDILKTQTEITPELITALYNGLIDRHIIHIGPETKTLQDCATNLAVIQQLDKELPNDQRVLTLSDEIHFFRNSLIFEIANKVRSIETSIKENGFLNNLVLIESLSGELTQLDDINFLATELYILQKDDA